MVDDRRSHLTSRLTPAARRVKLKTSTARRSSWRAGDVSPLVTSQVLKPQARRTKRTTAAPSGVRFGAGRDTSIAVDLLLRRDRHPIKSPPEPVVQVGIPRV